MRNANTTLNEFYVTLDDFERKRSDKLKAILSLYSKKVCDIAHVTPFKVQEQFEMMILVILINDIISYISC